METMAMETTASVKYVLVNKDGEMYSSVAPGYKTRVVEEAYIIDTQYIKGELKDQVRGFPEEFRSIQEVRIVESSTELCVSKWMVSNVQKSTSGETITLSPIQTKDIPEDKMFTKFTPSGTQTFFLCNPALIGKYYPGQVVFQFHLPVVWELCGEVISFES